MNHQSKKFRFRGITLIELFGALATLAVVLSFSSGPMERMSARIEVDVARKEVVEALMEAQRAARRNQLPVNVTLTQEHGLIRLKPEFAHRRLSFRLETLPGYTLPENITIDLPQAFSGWAYSSTGNLVQGEALRLSSQVNTDYVVEIPLVD